MATIVVGARRSVVDRVSILRDCKPIFLVPMNAVDEWRDANDFGQVYGISRWDSYSELVTIVGSLPPVSRVVALEEPAIAAAGFLRSLLGLPGQGFAQAVTFTDKAVMKRRLRDSGLPVARFAVVRSFGEVRSAARWLRWPVVVKPRRGFGTLSIVRIDNSDHLDHLVATGQLAGRAPVGPERALASTGVYDALEDSHDGFLVEEYVQVADEFSCDLVLWHGAERMVLTTRYVTPLLEATGRGRIGLTALPPDDEQAHAVADLTRRAVAALGLRTGHVHCEVFRTGAGEYVVGEIAARPGGGPIPGLIELLYGRNSMDVFAALSLGREPDRYTGPAVAPLAVAAMQAAPGRVERIPSTTELGEIPGFVSADVRVRVGQLVSGDFGSAQAAAYLYYSPTSLDSVAEEHDRVQKLASEMFHTVPESDAVRVQS